MGADPREILKGYVEISSLPMIHMRLEEAINNPKKSMADIAKVIRDDPGLTARLLRIVNSAFYSFPSKVETIPQAVTIVGTQQLGDLALATSVMNMFRGIPDEVVNMDSFWKHSIGCGLAARAIAAIRREPNVERFFVGGMLHDIGRLVIFTRCPDQAAEIVRRARGEKALMYEIEREVLGFTHALIGGILLQSWELPTSLEEAVMFHHAPRSATRFPTEAAIVHVADILTHALQLGSSGEHYVPPLEPSAWEKLQVPPSIIGHIEEQVGRQYADAVQTIMD